MIINTECNILSAECTSGLIRNQCEGKESIHVEQKYIQGVNRERKKGGWPNRISSSEKIRDGERRERQENERERDEHKRTKETEAEGREERRIMFPFCMWNMSNILLMTQPRKCHCPPKLGYSNNILHPEQQRPLKNMTRVFIYWTQQHLSTVRLACILFICMALVSNQNGWHRWSRLIS